MIILDKDLSGKFGIANNIPGACFFGSNFPGVVDYTARAPHVGNRVIVGIDFRIDLLEHLVHVGGLVQGYVVDGIRDGCEVQGKDEGIVEHALDDVV